MEVNMKVTIDRFEGSYAICEKENKEMINIERNRLPPNAMEGDFLLVEENNISIAKTATLEQKKKIKELMDDLWK